MPRPLSWWVITRYQLSCKLCDQDLHCFNATFNATCDLGIINQNMKYRIVLILYIKFCTCPRTSKLVLNDMGPDRTLVRHGIFTALSRINVLTFQNLDSICLDKSVLIKNLFSYFSTKTCVVGTQKNRLNVTVLLITQNITAKTHKLENIHNFTFKDFVYLDL